MSSLAGKVRKCDSFGASFKLSYQGEDTFVTLGGGIASICLRILVLTYFCIRTIDLIGYKDPDISSYVIMADREAMKEPYNL